MDKRMRFLVVLPAFLLASALCSCTVKHVVHPVGANPAAGEDGVYYFLPRTVLDVEVEFQKTTKSPGEFFALWSEIKVAPDDDEKNRYGDIVKQVKKLGLSDVKKESYKAKAPKITSRSEADPEACFKVEVGGGYFEDRSLEMKLNAMGVITSATAKAKDKSFDFALTTVEALAGIVGKAGVFGGRGSESSTRGKLLDEAERVLDDIKGLADEKFELDPKGIAPAVYDKHIAALDAAIKSRASYFGSKKTEKWTGHYAVRPESNDLGCQMVLVRYGDTGISHANVDGRVKEWQHAPEKWRTTTPTKCIVLELNGNVASDSKLPAEVVRADQGDVTGERGFYYRVPAQVACMVSETTSGTKVAVTRSVLPVAQLGAIASLPASTGTPETEFSVGFNESSGSLESLSITSKGGDPKVAERIGNVATGLIESKQGAEVKKLEERKKKLELEKSIRELEAELVSDDD